MNFRKLHFLGKSKKKGKTLFKIIILKKIGQFIKYEPL